MMQEDEWHASSVTVRLVWSRLIAVKIRTYIDENRNTTQMK